MASFHQINYALRPAKAVERKMMIEAFRRLERGWRLPEYRYLGMGSIYFADFQLVHQILGINDLISMEREENHKARFEFNRPYRCVDIRYGESSKVLGELPWDKKVLAWLDYDGKLTNSMVADLKTVVKEAVSGSVVCISINMEPDQFDSTSKDEVDEKRLTEFTSRVGVHNLPLGTQGSDLRGPKLRRLHWQILTSAVSAQLAERNGKPVVREDTMYAKQVFHFKYADGAAMLTLGWVLHSSADTQRFDLCDFNSLAFSSDSESCIDVHAPRLTPKEIRHLNARLPDGEPVASKTVSNLAEQTGIPKTDIERFAGVYRHYPHYAEIAL